MWKMKSFILQMLAHRTQRMKQKNVNAPLVDSKMTIIYWWRNNGNAFRTHDNIATSTAIATVATAAAAALSAFIQSQFTVNLIHSFLSLSTFSVYFRSFGLPIANWNICMDFNSTSNSRHGYKPNKIKSENCTQDFYSSSISNRNRCNEQTSTECIRRKWERMS